MNVYTIVILGSLLALTLAAVPKGKDLDHSYSHEMYMHDFGKRYVSQQEKNTRASLFKQRVKSIIQHNSKTNTDGSPFYSWTLGINHMTDWTDDERAALNGYRPLSAKQRDSLTLPVIEFSSLHEPRTVQQLPSSVDWRTKSVVSAVKDQGQCGSCWSFATAETVESHYALATGMLEQLSEQQVLDCTPNVPDCGGTGGCGGGTPELGFEHIKIKGGLASEWTYPYISYFGNDFNCSVTKFTPPVAKVDSRVKLPHNELEPTMTALADVGPLAITVDANNWHDYEGGVYNGCNQTNPHLDHNVQLVGYGTDPDAGDYWLVRNSWMPSWGENGYIRLARNSDPSSLSCGVDTHPEDGTGCYGGSDQITVCGTCGILYDNSYPIIKS